jgi:hypothetical protein
MILYHRQLYRIASELNRLLELSIVFLMNIRTLSKGNMGQEDSLGIFPAVGNFSGGWGVNN